MDSKVPTCEITIKKRKEIDEYIVDETLLKIGFEYIWLWVAIDPKNQGNSRTFLVNKSKERNMFVAERFLSNIVKIYGKHPVSKDGGSWYPQACEFLTRSSCSFLSCQIIEKFD